MGGAQATEVEHARAIFVRCGEPFILSFMVMVSR